MYVWLNYIKEASLMMFLGVIVILLVKKAIGRHMTTSWNYYIWLLVLLQLSIPAGIAMDAEYNLSSFVTYTERQFVDESIDSRFYVENMEEFESDVVSSKGNNEDQTLFYIWISGAIILSLYLLMGRISLKKTEFKETESKVLYNCLIMAEEKTGYKRKIKINSSGRIKTPAVCGVLRPVIICPDNIVENYSEKEMVYMLAHELTHIKWFHNVLQGVSLLCTVVFWFNPVSWILFNSMKNDAEIMCDKLLSKNMDKIEKIEYGKLLLTAAGNRRSLRIEPALALSQKGKLLNYRIESLLSNEIRSRTLRVASILVFIILFMFMTTGAGSMRNISREEALMKIHDANGSGIVANIEFYDYTYCIEGITSIEDDVYRIKYLFDGDKLTDVKYYSINGNTGKIEEFKELYLSWI